jgi:hypothetical protein
MKPPQPFPASKTQRPQKKQGREPPPRRQKGQGCGPRKISGQWLDIRAAAEYIGVTEKLVRTRCARGLLPYRRWGRGTRKGRGRIIFSAAELEQFRLSLPGISVADVLRNLRTPEGKGEGA